MSDLVGKLAERGLNAAMHFKECEQCLESSKKETSKYFCEEGRELWDAIALTVLSRTHDVMMGVMGTTDVQRVSLDIKCPTCEKKFAEDALCARGSPLPEKGSLTMCPKCLAFLRFDSDKDLHEMSVEELLDIDPAKRNKLYELRRNMQSARRLDA